MSFLAIGCGLFGVLIELQSHHLSFRPLNTSGHLQTLILSVAWICIAIILAYDSIYYRLLQRYGSHFCLISQACRA